jgi:biopolymer transport protein TolR
LGFSPGHLCVPRNIRPTAGVQPATKETPMAMTSGDQGLRSEINVTPMIDVLLVLLIIFMMIQPSSQIGLNALIPDPPKSQTQPDPNPETIVVQVLGDDQHGITYKINETSVSRLDIEPQLAAIFAVRDNKTMFIKGDPALDFATIADVINSGHYAGIKNIGIITPQATRVQ